MYCGWQRCWFTCSATQGLLSGEIRKLIRCKCVKYNTWILKKIDLVHVGSCYQIFDLTVLPMEQHMPSVVNSKNEKYISPHFCSAVTCMQRTVTLQLTAWERSKGNFVVPYLVISLGCTNSDALLFLMKHAQLGNILLVTQTLPCSNIFTDTKVPVLFQ